MALSIIHLLSIKVKRIQIALLIILFSSFLFYLLQNRASKQSIVEDMQNGVSLPTDKVHIFYDASYRNKKIDKYYQGWFWSSERVNILDSAFYPEQGLYSSSDIDIVDLHMKQIRYAGVGVVVVSWWPENNENSPPLPLILNRAQKYGLKVTIHIQKYAKRTIDSIIKDLMKVITKYSQHAAFYKLKVPNKKLPLPLIYIYEPLEINPKSWRVLLDASSRHSIRETKYDALYVGLIKEETDRYVVANSDFDGFYTMFSHSDFTYAATWFNWPHIEDFARDRQLIFIPTVSPGYDYRLRIEDIPSQIIPPITIRYHGRFYQNAWLRALVSRSGFIAINSFNGWQAGTQIEPARMNDELKADRTNLYDDYSPASSNQYLELTRKWVIGFCNRSLFRRN